MICDFPDLETVGRATAKWKLSSGRMRASIKKALAADRLQRGWPRCWLLTISFLLIFVPCGRSMAATVAIACGAVGIELELCRQGTEAWAAQTGHKVTIISTPNDANERLALFQQLLAARSPDVDVFQIDVVWPGILAPYLLDLGPHVTAEETARHSQVLIANNSVNGRLVALPWFADAGVLYFRRDVLAKYGAAVPDTWRQLTETARKIQDSERARGRGRMWGFVWQGRAYEGLTCNALEWIHSAGGGTIVDPTGRVTVDNAKAAAALMLAASWIGSITPPGVLNYAEEEARGVFQAGDAVFMRNWPYAFALANQPESPVAGRIGIAPLPRSDDAPSSATLGGSQLAVSRYSRAPEVAVELVRALTSVGEQKRRAIKAGFPPTIEQLYEDPELLAARPLLGELQKVFAGAIARPSAVVGRRYNQVSNEFWNAVHDVLRRRRAAEASLAALAERLRFLSRGERW